MAKTKGDSVRQKMLSLLESMKLGETRRVHIPTIDTVRVASYKVGRFSFMRIAGERDMYDVTRRGIEAKSQRAIVRETLAKQPDTQPPSVVFKDMGLNNVRNYVRQYDEEFGTMHRVEPSDKGMVVTRDRAAEHCAALVAVLNNPNSSGGAIATALAVVSAYCKAEQARRFA